MTFALFKSKSWPGLRGGMTTHTCSLSGTTFTSELESIGVEEHNLWNLLLGILAHHMCSPVFKRSLCDEDLCKAALSCHFALDVLTIDNVHVARVRRWSGAWSSGG